MIDWTKPLECDGGDVIKISDGRGSVLVTFGKGLLAIEYTVYFDGNLINPRLPRTFTVRNKKTNRDRAIDVAFKAMDDPPFFMHPQRVEDFIDALIEAGLLKEDG